MLLPEQTHVVSDGRVFWIDNFLNEDTCTRIETALPSAPWFRSVVYVKHKSIEHHLVGPLRTSHSTSEDYFNTELRRIMSSIDEKLEVLIPNAANRREAWQVTRYAQGERFGYHLDCGSRAHEPGGDREYTALIYLNTPISGGITRFRRLALDVIPIQGRLLVFRNLNERQEPDLEMLHCSLPLVTGSKLILVTWIRQRPLRGAEDR
jgi:prolyl 4-hydroxylase